MSTLTPEAARQSYLAADHDPDLQAMAVTVLRTQQSNDEWKAHAYAFKYAGAVPGPSFFEQETPNV